jgi:hypothetical protein
MFKNHHKVKKSGAKALRNNNMGKQKPGFECRYIPSYRECGPPGSPFIFREFINRNRQYRNPDNTFGEKWIEMESQGRLKSAPDK